MAMIYMLPVPVKPLEILHRPSEKFENSSLQTQISVKSSTNIDLLIIRFARDMRLSLSS